MILRNTFKRIVSNAVILGFVLLMVQNERAFVPGDITENENVLRGRITDLLGNAIGSASVRLLVDENRVISQIRTDENGNFLAQKLPSGKFQLIVEAVGFKTEFLELQLDENETLVVNLGLRVGQLSDLDSYIVMGEIRDPKGEPVADANILVISPFNKQVTWETKTARDGRYRVSVDQAGQFIVIALKQAFLIECRTVLLEPPQIRASSRTVNFILRRYR